VDLVADGDEPAVEVQALAGEVDVGPLMPRTSLRRIPVIAAFRIRGWRPG
jgi:hypothetical protein